VSRRDCHPPGVDLGRAKLTESAIAEHRGRFREQPAQLLDCRWLRVVLVEVLVDELGKGQRVRQSILAAKLLERSRERLAR
jgi:hypothetical protein